MKQELGHLVSGRFSGAHLDPNFVVRERGVAVSDAQAETGEVADVDHHPGLGLRPLAASPATHDVGGGLDGDDQLSLRLDHVEDAEPVQSQKRLRQPGTVAHRQGSPVVAAVEKPQRWRDLWREWWMPLPHGPHFNAEVHFGAVTQMTRRRRQRRRSARSRARAHSRCRTLKPGRSTWCSTSEPVARSTSWAAVDRRVLGRPASSPQPAQEGTVPGSGPEDAVAEGTTDGLL